MKIPCITCGSLDGKISLTPGGVIFSGTHWQIEHANPTSIKGWLVCILKRHANALHELDGYEFTELAKLQRIATLALHEVLQSEKEYAVCFAESEGFQHIHFHIIARPKDLPGENKGSLIFSCIGKGVAEPLSADDIINLSTALKNVFEKLSLTQET